MVSGYNDFVSGQLQEIASQSAETLVSRIRSLIGDDKIWSARELTKAALRQHPDSEELKALFAALNPGDAMRSHLQDSSHRANMEWLTQHQEEHRGEWVALVHGKLVAADARLEELMAALEDRGSHGRPLIHHIPE